MLRLAATAMLFQCFMTLHMMRKSNGFGPEQISLGEIMEYQEMFGAMPVDLDILVRVIKECDDVALDWLGKKIKSKG